MTEMKIYMPDFGKSFACIGGRCPDNCCRQGWQISVDEPHRKLYETMPEAQDAVNCRDGEVMLSMHGGTCDLLRRDGLCTLAAKYGEEALCHICHTHPRLIEQYGSRREIHFSLSCPEVARLALERTNALRFTENTDEEQISEPNELDPKQYFTLLKLRRLCIRIMQDRTVSVRDRIMLVLRLGFRMQRCMDCGKYTLCVRLLSRWYDADYRLRQLAKLKRLQYRPTSRLADLVLLEKLEHLTEEICRLLPKMKNTALDTRPCIHAAENLIVLWLSHYIPKAVNDNHILSKIEFAVFGWLFVCRACAAAGKSELKDIEHYAGLFAKEAEHSEDNLRLYFETWRSPGWYEHFLAEI